MGQLINGKWTKDSIVTSGKHGDYQRKPRSFKSFIGKEHSEFTVEAGRYHLYVSYACPWATRTLIYRSLKHLEDLISVDVVHPNMLEDGWTFEQNYPHCTGDSLYHAQALKDLYLKADPTISTSVTVPVLWDKKLHTIVNNESSDIIRMFNTSFNTLTGDQNDYYPSAHRSEIDAWNTRIYDTVNNGVYRAGFAKSQESYDQAVHALFSTLSELNQHLASHSHLVANRLTEADLRLIPTLMRFDSVYHTHFKCNVFMLRDFPHLLAYARRIAEIPAVRNTYFPDHIKQHYYYSHLFLNPQQIIPSGPQDPFDS